MANGGSAAWWQQAMDFAMASDNAFAQQQQQQQQQQMQANMQQRPMQV